ncbi:response regulator [Candidatus Woesearchaeota archaeon]|nr:response regulator [Candidatus Woesearchaeota archaeon]
MNKTILIVDDEPHIIELEKAILEMEGFKIISAENGTEALAKLKKTTPDLVILDMMMPKMSGREVCEKIRSDPKTKNLRVVFVTVARFSEIGKDKLKDLNVSDYITKPFENEEFVKRIKKALE